MSNCIVLYNLLCLFYCSHAAEFSFANSFGDNMVLQQHPHMANIWGFANNGDIISITITNTNTSKVYISGTRRTDNDGIWSYKFDSPTAVNDIEYLIKATSSNTTARQISLQNILFGDVYICSGQSNMRFTVDSAFNASQSLSEANNYANIRVYTVNQGGTPQPQNQINIEEKWSIANNKSIGGGNWTYFSALCWFYGQHLYDTLNYPLGLIDTAYGGTPIRYWMSPDALKLCPNETNDIYDVGATLNNSYLWNAQIYPFLRMSIKGAIWYQASADSNTYQYASSYQCAFPAMINDWRSKWLLLGGNTNNYQFPFGFIHYSPWDDTKNVTCGDGDDSKPCLVAIMRDGQTANYGYVANDKMENTFMGTAIDLGDADSPFGDIHPRYKKAAAVRLANAAFNVIYNKTEIYWHGPIAFEAVLSSTKNGIIVSFRNIGNDGLLIKNSIGFEIYDNNQNSWIYVTDLTVISNGNDSILVPLPSKVNAIHIASIRYNWYQAPCQPVTGIELCSIYDKQYELPALPFILNVTQ